MCPSRDDEAVRCAFDAWKKQPTVKTRRQIRQGAFPVASRRRTALPPGAALRAREQRRVKRHARKGL